MQSQQETHNGGNEDARTEEVDLEDAGQDGHVERIFRVAVNVQDEDDNEHSEATDGEVDVEAPSPGDVFCESTAEERTGDGGDSPHATDETKGKGTLVERHYRNNPV